MASNTNTNTNSTTLTLTVNNCLMANVGTEFSNVEHYHHGQRVRLHRRFECQSFLISGAYTYADFTFSNSIFSSLASGNVGNLDTDGRE